MTYICRECRSREVKRAGALCLGCSCASAGKKFTAGSGMGWRPVVLMVVGSVITGGAVVGVWDRVEAKKPVPQAHHEGRNPATLKPKNPETAKADVQTPSAAPAGSAGSKLPVSPVAKITPASSPAVPALTGTQTAPAAPKATGTTPAAKPAVTEDTQTPAGNTTTDNSKDQSQK